MFLTKGTTKHPGAVSTKCSHHCYLMIPIELLTVICHEPFNLLYMKKVDSYLILSVTASQWSLQDECWEEETLILMDHFLPSTPHS